MKFTYRWGQKPLDGYTIKRGLGQGGFGEVYFAVSDGGKEVALKLIRGHSDTELRGIANCLNLKHPHLVHLFDLKIDAQGDRWLVMEYVHGESLGNILRRNPSGLPEAQARQWFLQAAAAVAYLHDHAIVHRDIKPANLFVENDAVKLGDYGLSKSVGASQHSQSSNVGTIHYMAPEIASGSYSKQVDIYACGVMLFEMLTGEVPFKGESWTEIALKHQTDLPDMSRVPARYVPVLEKALNKRAERRFNDMKEMIHAVEAIDRQAPARTVSPSKPSDPVIQLPPPLPPKPAAPVSPAAVGRHWNELAHGLLLAPIPAVPATAVWAIFTGSVHWTTLGKLYLLMVATAWVVLAAAKCWEGLEHSKQRRVLLTLGGLLIGLAAFLLNGWVMPEITLQDEPATARRESYWGGIIRAEPGGLEALIGYLVFFSLALGIPRWWQSAERNRAERFTLYPLLASGAWGLILLGVWKNVAALRTSEPPGLPGACASGGRGLRADGGGLDAQGAGCHSLSASAASHAANGVINPQEEDVVKKFIGVILGWLALAWIAGSTRASENAPPFNGEPQVLADGTMRFYVIGEFRKNPSEAKASALQTAQDRLRAWLAAQENAPRRAPSLETIRREMVKREYPPQTEPVSQGESYYRVAMEIDLKPSHIRDLRERDRVIAGLWLLGTALAMVGIVGILFRIDEWTKGYLTRWLIAIGILAAVGLVSVFGWIR